MVRLNAVALAIAGMLVAPTASADDVNFAAFHRICLATGGERSAALAAAEAEGFVQPPKLILEQVEQQSAVPLNNAEVRAKLVTDGIVWVSVGQMGGLFENRYTSTDMCLMGVNPMSPASETAVIAWGGITPAVSDPQYHMLFFTGPEGAHVAVPKPDDKMTGGVTSGARLQLLGAGNTEGVTLMLYGVVKAVAKPSPAG